MAEHIEEILIVEDEPDNREIMRAVVEDLLGYQAVQIEDASHMLDTIEKRRPALILMDLMMPVLDGFEAIRLLKGAPDTANIPVIAVTALSRPVDRQRALDAGADDYVSKPFDLDNLITKMERFLAGSHGSVEDSSETRD